MGDRWLTVGTGWRQDFSNYREVRLNLDHVFAAEMYDSATPGPDRYAVVLKRPVVSGDERFYPLKRWATPEEAQAWIDRIMPSIE
jgi:hypothetical protein